MKQSRISLHLLAAFFAGALAFPALAQTDAEISEWNQTHGVEVKGMTNYQWNKIAKSTIAQNPKEGDFVGFSAASLPDENGTLSALGKIIWVGKESEMLVAWDVEFRSGTYGRETRHLYFDIRGVPTKDLYPKDPIPLNLAFVCRGPIQDKLGNKTPLLELIRMPAETEDDRKLKEADKNAAKVLTEGEKAELKKQQDTQAQAKAQAQAQTEAMARVKATSDAAAKAKFNSPEEVAKRAARLKEMLDTNK